MTDPSDQDLLTAWRAGDADSGDELVRRHFSSVYRFFAGKIDDRIDDLVQRTFLVCLERPERLHADSTMRAFLLGIARNILFEHYRALRKELKMTAVGDLSAESLGSPSRLAVKQDEHKLLLLALRRIPLDFQIALELFYWEEMSIADTAQVLQVAPGTVKSRLHRGKTMLREQLNRMEGSSDLVQSTLGNLDGWARSMRGALEKPDK